MENFPVHFVSTTSSWGNPVMAGVDRAGQANGAGDGTVDWGSDGCRVQSFDIQADADQTPQPPSNGQ